MNKRVLLVGVIFLAVVVVVILLVSGRPTTPGGELVQPTLAPPAPSGGLTQPPNVAFSFATQPNIPATLPTYTFESMPLASIEALAAKAAATLGLSATPSALTRGDSYTKTWSRTNEAALTVTQTLGRVTMTFRQAKTSQSPGSLAPDVAVQQFLLALVPPTASLSVRAAGTESGPFNGLLVFDTPPPASYQNYFYSYTVSSYPVLSPDLSLVPMSVIADSGGIIRFANIVPPPLSVQAGRSVPLLTPDQVLASLAAGRGSLLDTHNPQTPDQGAVPNFSKLVIEEAKIVYAPEGNQLLPALYMTGTGTSTGGAVQKATLFLWLLADTGVSQP